MDNKVIFSKADDIPQFSDLLDVALQKDVKFLNRSKGRYSKLGLLTADVSIPKYSLRKVVTFWVYTSDVQLLINPFIDAVDTSLSTMVQAIPEIAVISDQANKRLGDQVNQLITGLSSKKAGFISLISPIMSLKNEGLSIPIQIQTIQIEYQSEINDEVKKLATEMLPRSLSLTIPLSIAHALSQDKIIALASSFIAGKKAKTDSSDDSSDANSEGGNEKSDTRELDPLFTQLKSLLS